MAPTLANACPLRCAFWTPVKGIVRYDPKMSHARDVLLIQADRHGDVERFADAYDLTQRQNLTDDLLARRQGGPLNGLQGRSSVCSNANLASQVWERCKVTLTGVACSEMSDTGNRSDHDQLSLMPHGGADKCRHILVGVASARWLRRQLVGKGAGTLR